MIRPPATGNKHRPPAEVVVRRDAVDERQRPVIKQVGEEIDQLQEDHRDHRAKRPDDNRDRHDPEQPDVGREIPKLTIHESIPFLRIWHRTPQLGSTGPRSRVDVLVQPATPPYLGRSLCQ